MLAIFRHNFVNILFFNAIWFTCVIGRLDWIWISAPVLLIYILTNFPSPQKILLYVAVPAAIGILIDAVLIQLNVFVFPKATTWMPLWLVVLWLGFATTLTKSLALFGKRPVLAVAAGMFGFPLSYLTAHRFGAVDFGYSTEMVALLLSAIWAIMLPTLFWILKREARNLNAD
jgi:hypothetical protein